MPATEMVQRAHMPFLSGYKTELKQIPYGNQGIFLSVSDLIDLIRKGRKNPQVRLTAARIIQHCPNKDYMCEAKSISRWIQNNIRFTRDIYHVELLQGAEVTLQEGYGDCDCHVILLNSMLQSIGIPTRVVLVASRKALPKHFNHIFTEALLPTPQGERWIAMDTTPLTRTGKMAKFGYLPRGYTEKRIEVA